LRERFIRSLIFFAEQGKFKGQYMGMTRWTRGAGLTIALFYFCSTSFVEAQHSYLSDGNNPHDFPLSANKKSASVFASESDYPGVLRAVKNLQQDIGHVTDITPDLNLDQAPSGEGVVIVGTIGKNPQLDQLIRNKKIDVTNIHEKWEAFTLQIIENPFPKVKRALVIAGSDKRGTIFGIYELSRQIGVSPWYWWADVPPKKSKTLFISSGLSITQEPAVRYRGIFINDEEPCLGRLAVEKFGGFNHAFYEKVFELILRLKGNYLWPAMWWASFNSDDPLNPRLADEYGIVMGTTHHEPLMRAHAEWKTYHGGDWNYETNPETLRKFWTEGVQRMGNRESIVSVGMRGDGDKAMTAETNIALLEKIVRDQRKIIRDVTGQEEAKTPQLWALYKEVQDYYDRGMRVPDDITLLLCDDNWGNIRKLPRLTDKPRAGGYGIYYHFDYVGDPRNYKWINTNPIIKTWEQMHLAYNYGVDRIWIVNVGDIKPLEFPISFFLDYAWNPKKWDQNSLTGYTRQWCEEQFGRTYASEIADIIERYSKYNARRKPELLTPETYSLVNYREAEKIVQDFQEIEKHAEAINANLPPSLRDAYYQLVLHPVKACDNLNQLYVTAGRNRLYALQGRASTNVLAEQVKVLFQKDSSLSAYYNKTLAGGKWNNLMNQVHIGYTYWQDPKQNVIPETKTIEIPDAADIGVSIEGSSDWWPSAVNEAILPVVDHYKKQTTYFEVFNRGQTPFDFSISTSALLKLSIESYHVEKESRVEVAVDWEAVPKGISKVPITITGPRNKKIVINAVIDNNDQALEPGTFAESDRHISIEAEHFCRAVTNSGISWNVLPDYGRTLSGVTPFPVTSAPQTPGRNSPHLEYDLNFADTATVTINMYLGTTLNFAGGDGLHLAVSIDDEKPQLLNIHYNETAKSWGKTVEDNTRLLTARSRITAPGKHVLKYWMIDPGIVLQKIVLDAGGVRPSYLGPPESYQAPALKK
jgi:Glycosyl hydrolase family 115/Gylcosyl hydrolase family 115 C-terminal domain